MTTGTEYTIDELAREAGTTVRSLRVYHERGVLPPPQVKGRTGFYSAEHLNRVRTISRLLDRGIKLNGIKELLNAWDRGDDLGDILGVAEPDASSATESPAGGTIAATELEQRLRDVPNGLARVVALGLYEPVDATTYRAADPALLRAADQLAAAGVPEPEILAEFERLAAECDRIARRFADLFQRTVWTAFQQSEGAPADVARLAAGSDAVRTVSAQAGAELVGRYVARYLEQDTALSEALADS
ncbi:MerR family transcriptional regulator [Nocardia veterana]|uniref:MerR family transcriptional regulator n=1 Tax=Nocardia veterana TaxID=132249 RepID=A0A7X6RIL1_9NOCA|nr:MerR family transcriptional regulator [Nocardia veterana]NKY87261.1 MerR family transcriptional regulator [Nocardia veterana]